MKASLLTLTLTGAVWLAGTAANAQDNLRAGQPYVGVDLGPVFQQNVYIRNAGRSVSLDPGVRADVHGGFNFTDNLAAEIETGALSSRVRDPQMVLGGNRAYLQQVPLLANVIIRAPLIGGVTPYVGGGVGTVISDIALRQNGHWTDDADATFAYDATAGVTVALARHFDVGIAYKFLGSTDHTFFRDDPALYTPTGKIFSHAVVATFTVSF